MKQVFLAFIAYKNLYATAFSVGALLTTICSFVVENTPSYLFGINIALWFIAFIINLIDIKTGWQADAVRSKKEGTEFKFKSRKGWRAFEKIFVFTLIIWFVYTMELEAIRLQVGFGVATILMAIKFIMLCYVVLIEIQSIGENEETRFGEKSKMFTLLDKVILIVNEGILTNIKKVLRIE